MIAFSHFVVNQEGIRHIRKRRSLQVHPTRYSDDNRIKYVFFETVGVHIILRPSFKSGHAVTT